jgi:hypothetical protein
MDNRILPIIIENSKAPGRYNNYCYRSGRSRHFEEVYNLPDPGRLPAHPEEGK